MKTLLYTTFFICTTLSCFGQITIMPANDQAKKYDNFVYDSLSNFERKKYNDKYTYHHLIGQTVMYCGYPYMTHKTFPFIIGEYYRIDSILPDNTGQGLYDRLVLTNIKSGKIDYEGDLTSKKYNYKWIVQGYYDKMKSLYTGREFVYMGLPYHSYNKQDNFINLETDTVTKNIEKGSVWTCVDAQVKPRTTKDQMEIDNRNPLVLIFDNSDYGKHYCYIEDKLGQPYRSLVSDEIPLLCGRFQDKEYHDNIIALNIEAAKKRKAEMIQKYGNHNGSLIAQGKITIGMNKKMCRDAWGTPNNINVTSTTYGSTEQWVYGYSYVYFEDGVITVIQN